MDTTPLNLLAQVKDSGFWFPTDASANNQVDALAYFILIICGVFLVFNAGLMVFFAMRYRFSRFMLAAHGVELPDNGVNSNNAASIKVKR